jgi:hypothetical protein
MEPREPRWLIFWLILPNGTEDLLESWPNVGAAGWVETPPSLKWVKRQLQSHG